MNEYITVNAVEGLTLGARITLTGNRCPTTCADFGRLDSWTETLYREQMVV